MKSTHNVKAYRNSMDSTAGKAPFLGTYISHENVPIDALCAQVSALCGLTAIQVRAILEGSFDAIAELEREGLVVVHLDGMSVWAALTGSFPSADAAFDPERNALNLTVRLDESVRLAIVGATAQMVTDADLTKVRVDNVKDMEVERPVNLIHGQHVFRVAGYNLVLDDAGARVYLKGKAGTEHGVVVDEALSKQLFIAHTAELLEGGDYTLWVESRGGDAEGPLQKDRCRVKYLRVTDPPTGDEPELERGYSEGEGHPDGCVFPYYAFILQGVNLDGAAVKIGYTEEGTYREVDVPDEKLTVTDTVITIASDSVELEDAIAAGGTVTFKATTAGGTATYEAEVQS
jgi:hypothetical protein